MPTFPVTTGDPVPTYTPDQISTHDTEIDCWLQIHDKVYDVTEYLDTHPGGAEVIMDTAGGNATDMFEDIGHSKGAIRQLTRFQVGMGEVNEVVGTKDVVDGLISGNQLMPFLCVSIVVAIGAIAVWGRGGE